MSAQTSRATAGLTVPCAGRRVTREGAVEILEALTGGLVEVIAAAGDPDVQSRLTFLLADVLDAIDEIKDGL